MPNSQFSVTTLVSTSFTAHRNYFKPGGLVVLTVVADWNVNNVFEAGELISRSSLKNSSFRRQLVDRVLPRRHTTRQPPDRGAVSEDPRNC
jgi:hypothetical protein